MDYSINLDAILYTIKNEALNKIMCDFSPDQKTKEMTNKLLRALNKRGVETQTFIDALVEASTAE